MARFVFALIGACALAVAGRAADVVVSQEELVPRERLADMIRVRDITTEDGTVSGTIVNDSDQRLKDVHLLVRHLWLWKNEMHPGTDDLSRSDEYVVPGEIPPHGTKTFQYRGSASPVRSDGHFEVIVEPVSLVAFSDHESGGHATSAPAIGERPEAGRPTDERVRPDEGVRPDDGGRPDEHAPAGDIPY